MLPHHLTPLDADRRALADPAYNPDRVFDTVMARLQLKNDAALARALEVAPPIVSKVRHKKLPIGASLLIRLHEVSGLTVAELRRLQGVQTVRLPVALAGTLAPAATPMQAIVSQLAQQPTAPSART